jgi:GDPmannose 4,6-dehydratase
VDFLQADPSKARRILNWNPKVRYHDLVKIMVDADLELIGLESPGKGRQIVEEKFDDWHNWEDQVVSMGR